MISKPPSSLPKPPPDLLDAASLFLDFDGTLVELASRHDAVKVGARLHALMGALLVKLDGRLAIVSGRPASEIRTLFGDPIFLICGSHGLEFHWPDGRVSAPPQTTLPEETIAKLDALALQHAGVIVEHKPYGVAIHFRLAPESEAACHALATQISHDTGLALQPGKMVIELKSAGADKGAAVEKMMREPPMAGARPIFFGDDATDEAGFAAATKLGGAGVLVGPQRATEAAYRLASVDDTLAWLDIAAGVAE